MIPCSKRQTVVKRSEDRTVLRCMNKQCGFNGQEVCEDICSRCPVRVYKRERPCKKLERPTPSREMLPVSEIEAIKDEEVRSLLLEAGMDVEDLDKAAEGGSPSYPPMSMQLWTYKEALVRWFKAGRPKREKEEVERIHKICSGGDGKPPCDWYDKENSRCKGCGCAVTVGSLAVFNKIRMATEHCPLEKW